MSLTPTEKTAVITWLTKRIEENIRDPARDYAELEYCIMNLDAFLRIKDAW